MGQAKQRKAEIMSLKTQAKQPELIGAYWGYNAAKAGDGFEFSEQTLIKGGGFDRKTAMTIIKVIKEAVDFQLAGLKNASQEVLEGASIEEYLDQEQDRLDTVVATFKRANYNLETRTLIEQSIIAACAISTLVKYGRMPQDEFNGDAYMFSTTNKQTGV